MDSTNSEPKVPGPNANRRIPLQAATKAAIPIQTGQRSGVSVPVYPKLPERPENHGERHFQIEPSYYLIFDAFLALVSVAFCILFFSKL